MYNEVSGDELPGNTLMFVFVREREKFMTELACDLHFNHVTLMITIAYAQ